MNDAERKNEVESLVGEKIKSDYFIDLYGLVKHITDYNLENEGQGDVDAAIMIENDEENIVDEESDEEERSDVVQ